MDRYRARIILFVIFVLSVILLIAVLKPSATGDQGTNNSSAATQKATLKLEANYPGTEQPKVGDVISVDVMTASLGVNQVNPGVAEIIIAFDPKSLTAEDVVVDDAQVLALNKNIDNEAGIVTIDVAVIGEGGFPSSFAIATISFKVASLDSTTTKVQLTNDVTYGYPDALDREGSELELTVDLGPSEKSLPSDE